MLLLLSLTELKNIEAIKQIHLVCWKSFINSSHWKECTGDFIAFKYTGSGNKVRYHNVREKTYLI